MLIQPLHDLVYLRLKEPDQTTESGIVIKQPIEHNTGTVIAMGPGSTNELGDVIPIDLEIGDEVIFSPHAGQRFDIEGEKLIALRESQILAVIS